jgi:hypothetical protein
VKGSRRFKCSDRSKLPPPKEKTFWPYRPAGTLPPAHPLSLCRDVHGLDHGVVVMGATNVTGFGFMTAYRD